MSVWGWLEDAAGTCGRAIETVADGIADGINAIADLVGKIPIIGGVFHGLLTIVGAPFRAMDALLQGRRIDDIVLGEFKDIVSGIRDIAPLAQSIISFIPGIGQGISGAIGGAIALANGANLSDALVEGLKDAMPGGPIARAALEAVEGAVRGENVLASIEHAVLSQLPPEVMTALTLVEKIAEGENVLTAAALAAIEEARGYLPDYAQIGLDIGLAVGQGRRLQDAVLGELSTLGPEKLSSIADAGIDLIQNSELYASGAAIYKGGMSKGSNVISQSVDAANQAYGILKQNVNELDDNPVLKNIVATGKNLYADRSGNTAGLGVAYSRACAINPNDFACRSYGLGEIGYATGLAVMEKYGLNEKMIATMRSRLSVADIITFDAATSMYVGAVMKPPSMADVASLAATVVIDNSIPIQGDPRIIARLGVVTKKINTSDPNVRWGIVRDKIRGQSPMGALLTLRSMIRTSPSAEIFMMTSRRVGVGYAPTNLSIGRATYFTVHGMKKADPSQRVKIVLPMSIDEMANTVAIEVMQEIKSKQGLIGLWNDMMNFIARTIYQTA